MTNPSKDVLIVEDDDSIRKLVAASLARVHAVINKPFDVHELRELAKGCVTMRRRHDGLERASA